MAKKNLRHFQHGAAIIEYGLLYALIAAVVIGVVSTTGGSVQSLFFTAAEAIPDGAPSAPVDNPETGNPEDLPQEPEEEEPENALVMRFTGGSASFLMTPAEGGGNDVQIDWGPAAQDSCDSALHGGATTISCEFTTSGPHLVKVVGKIDTLSEFDPSLLSIDSWGDTQPASLAHAFGGASNLISLPSDLPASVRSLSHAFAVPYWQEDQLRTIPDEIGSWDVSNVEDMTMLFDSTTHVPDITGWSPSKVTSMASMFYGSSFNQNIANWDVSSVRNFSGMFSHAVYFNGDISEWDTSSGTDLSTMFQNARAFNADIGNWDTSNAEFMYGMFDGTEGEMVFNQDLSSWNVSRANRLDRMFAYSNAQMDLSCWSPRSSVFYQDFALDAPGITPPRWGQSRPAQCGN